jgi:enamine deaminase RidA (YjgF/YER057c/UK114 family)
MRFAMLAWAVVAATQAAAAEPAFDPEARLRELGITLPQPPTPVANYVQAVRSGNLVFLAGHGPCGTISDKQKGKVPRDRTIEEAYAAARDVGVCLIASLKTEIGDLRKVRRIVKVLGMVNATETFTDHPKVVNGCSDLMVAVFGERGKHARAAVGMASLPVNLSVEIEMIVEVEP